MSESIEPLNFADVPTEPVAEVNPVPNHRAWVKDDGPMDDGPIANRREPSRTGMFSRSRQKQAKKESIVERILDTDDVPNRQGQFIKPLAEFYTGLGLMLMPVDPHCATAVIKSADKCAKAMDQLAHENETVRRWLKGFLTANALTAVVLAHAPIVMAILMHHVPFIQAKMANGIGDQVEAVLKGMNDAESS